MAKHLIIGTAGHVDHGKTALIKALTGFDCDTHKEEKERGITINLGFSHFDLPSGESVGIVDVPGHKDFIKTMVAGAFGIDIVLLVIAADSGIMPQTIEHLNIIKMLGIKHGIVALTKTDLVDDEMLELAKLEAIEFMEGTVFENAPVIGVSSVTGKGLDDLIQQIEKLIPNVPEREKGNLFRMYIDRIFNVKGHGYIVTGSVLNGEIETGREVFLLPGKGKKIKIRNIERHGKPVNKIFCGDRAALNLSGIKLEEYKRGMLLSDKLIDESPMIDAALTLFKTDVQLGLWSRLIFHTGTFSCFAKIHLLDKDILKSEESAIVQIHLDKPAILLKKDKFILRNSSNDFTLGGGTIIDVKPLHHKKRTSKLLKNLKELVYVTLNCDNLYELIKLELKKENAPVLLEDLARKLYKSDNEILNECSKNNDDKVRVYQSLGKHILVFGQVDLNFSNSIIEHLRLWHQKFPLLEEGIETNEFSGKLSLSSNVGKLYIQELLQKLNKDGLIKKVENTWALSGHTVKVDSKTREKLDWLEETIKNCGKQKPVNEDIQSLALSRNINKNELKMMIKYLGKEEKLYFFGKDYLHFSIVDRCRNILLNELINKNDGINEKEFRVLIDGTKKISQVLTGIFLKEEIITKKTFYLLITGKGKRMLNSK